MGGQFAHQSFLTRPVNSDFIAIKDDAEDINDALGDVMDRLEEEVELQNQGKLFFPAPYSMSLTLPEDDDIDEDDEEAQLTGMCALQSFFISL